MMNRNAAIICATGAVTDAAIYNTIFLIFAVVQADRAMQPGAVPWSIVAAVLAMANYFLLRRSRAIPVFAVLNALGFAILLIVLLQGLGPAAGFAPVFFTVVFALISVGTISYRVLHPPTINKMLIKLDAFLICVAFYTVVTALGGLPVYYPFFLLCVLVMNVVVLAYLRAHGGEGFVRCASRFEGALVIAGSYGIVGALMILGVTLFSAGARDAAGFIAALLANGLRALWRVILRLFEFIASLFPNNEYSQPPDAMAPGEMGGEQTVLEAVEIDQNVLMIISVIIAALIFATLLFLVIRLRRKRLRIDLPSRIGSSVRTQKLGGVLWRRILSFLSGVLLRIKAWYYRNTPPGVLLYAERWGRRRGIVRGRGETHRDYFRRLADAPAITDETLPSLLFRLADELDARFYASAPSSAGLAARELRFIRSLLRGS